MKGAYYSEDENGIENENIVCNYITSYYMKS